VIEIIIHPSGDRAEAETPEAAIAAARQMIREQLDWYPHSRASFFVDGMLSVHNVNPY
jgi:hypothetical protein